ncbi:lytic transglycosylase domain-containing protein, partial [Escherichia coli]|nr:lytic transglycosylase domain-containing protein [Escherichia coli]
GGFPEGRYTHAFLVRQHDGENTFADECGIFIATGDTGQYRINVTGSFKPSGLFPPALQK